MHALPRAMFPLSLIIKQIGRNCQTTFVLRFPSLKYMYVPVCATPVGLLHQTVPYILCSVAQAELASFYLRPAGGGLAEKGRGGGPRVVYTN